MSEMLKQVAAAKEHAKSVVRGEVDPESEVELPGGSDPIEAKSEDKSAEVVSEEVESVEAAEPEEEIIIGDQTFTKKSDAVKYAQQLAREKDITEAHASGIREALDATRKVESAPPVEDNFEEEFYANPKEAFRKVRESAVAEAETRIEQKMERERMWSQFLTENPDIRRSDAERILRENFGTIGKMTDVVKAQKALALKVRSEYAEILEYSKPRTALPGNRTQSVSPGGGAPNRVTPSKESQKPLSFAEEMRRMKNER